MIGISVATSNIVTLSGSLQDTFLYLLVSNSAPIVRARDKGPRSGSPAKGWANLTTRVFYSKLLLHRSVKDTRCIDSNLESGRYISRVGRASRFLSR